MSYSDSYENRSNDDLQGLFEPVVSKILSLVRQQVEYANEQAARTVINRIILVGGFGDSYYLRKAFLDEFANEGNIRVTTPGNAQAAIVQGAALRGLEGLFARSRRCRRHYGYTCGEIFRDGVDKQQTAYFDSFEGQKRCRGRMTWVTRKGQQFPVDHSQELPVYRTHSVGEGLVFTDTLCACDSETAPDRVEHKDVRKVGDITVDFRNVNLSVFKTKQVSGRLVYKLDYYLNVIFGAQEGMLKFEARANGQVIGKTSVDFARALFY